MKKKCPECGSVKTVASEAPSKRVTGSDRGARAAASRQSPPTHVDKSGFYNVNHCGENPRMIAQMKAYEDINRIDTPKQQTSGGPAVMNKGEHIFTIYPRRTDQGRTIRSNVE